MKRRVAVPLALSLTVAAYLLLWPVPIDPIAWSSPVDAGYTGRFAVNNRLDGLRRLSLGAEHSGPEDAVTGPDGRVYASVRQGRIVILAPATGSTEIFADTGGKPLGVEFGPDGRLYVADAYRGLLAIDPAGVVSVLADRDEHGDPLLYVDDLDVAADGAVFFSDASSKFGAEASGGTYPASLLDLMEHGGHGRLLRYDPRAGSVTTILDGLDFANGVALADDDSFVLVNETGHYRVLKHWLSGPNAGQTEVLLSNLPGFPDNLNRSADGSFWCGLISPRSPALDGLASRPWLRRVVQRLPAFLRPKATFHGCVVRFDADGNVLETLQAPGGSYALTTGAADGPDGTTLVTSLKEAQLGWLP